MMLKSLSKEHTQFFKCVDTHNRGRISAQNVRDYQQRSASDANDDFRVFIFPHKRRADAKHADEIKATAVEMSATDFVPTLR